VVYVQPSAPAPKTDKSKEGKDMETAATVLLKAPTDVRVLVNGQPTQRAAAEQTFVTPALEPGRTYSYEFTAEAVRDGKTVTRRQTVYVRAGRQSRVDFTDLAKPAEGVAQVETSSRSRK
jgi:uncharacterized protein (TIGR03000 family)